MGTVGKILAAAGSTREAPLVELGGSEGTGLSIIPLLITAANNSPAAAITSVLSWLGTLEETDAGSDVATVG